MRLAVIPARGGYTHPVREPPVSRPPACDRPVDPGGLLWPAARRPAAVSAVAVSRWPFGPAPLHRPPAAQVVAGLRELLMRELAE